MPQAEHSVFYMNLRLLLDSNLIKGGDVNNAIIVVENEIPKEKLANLQRHLIELKLQLIKKDILTT